MRDRGFGRSGRARCRGPDQSRRHPVRARPPALRRSAYRRRRTRREGRARAWRAMVHVSAIGADANSVGALCAQQGDENSACSRPPRRRRYSAFDHVRPRRRFLQPFRCACEDVAGAAADRRRSYQIPAGIRRRRGAAIAKAVGGEARPGTVYELGGPEVLTSRRSCSTCWQRSNAAAAGAACRSGWPRCRRPSCNSAKAAAHARPGRSSATTTSYRKPPSPKCAHLEALGIHPEAMQVIVPTYLWRFRKTGQFTQPTGEGASGAADPLPRKRRRDKRRTSHRVQRN